MLLASERAYARRVTRPKPEGRPAWQALVALAGAATAIAIFVYLIGGAIVWARLHTLGLPANQGVAPLPRELLVVVGVRALAWPLVLGVLAIVFVQVVFLLRLSLRWTAGWKTVLAAVVALYLVSIVLASHYLTVQWLIFIAAFGLLVGVGSTFAIRKPVALLRAEVGVFLAMVAVGVVVESTDVYRLPVLLEYAHVRFTAGTEEKGFLIGVTPDTVYLAPNRDCHVLDRIVAVSRRDVVKIEISSATKAWSRESEPDDCPSPR